MKFLSPQQAQMEANQGQEEQGNLPKEDAAQRSALKTREKLESFFHKTPGEAAHATGQAALGAGAKLAGSVESGLLKLKEKQAALYAKKHNTSTISNVDNTPENPKPTSFKLP